MATKEKTKANKPRSGGRLHLDRRAANLVGVAHDGGDDDLLTTLQVAGWLGVSEQWLELGRSKHYGPPYQRLAPQIVRYKRGVVKAWLKEREYLHASQYTDRRSSRRDAT